MRTPQLDYLLAILSVVLCTAISVPLRNHFAMTDFAMVYLLGVIVVSMKCRRGAAVFCSILSVVAFHFFFVPYFDSFVLIDDGSMVTLVTMLTVALVISSLTNRIRIHTRAAMKAEMAVETERLKNSLLSAVSHDIKTPLASIYGAATSLLSQEDRLTRESRMELVENIADEADRLNRLITNLLEMTRLDAGIEVKRDWQSVEEIVGVALTRLESTLAGRSIAVRIPAQLSLICVDEVLIEQVFINLLDNVAKYTPSGTPVEIVAAESGEFVTITVFDKGPGFAHGDEDRLFEKFFRGKTGGTRGAGLGLAICRAIIHAHEGTIAAGNRGDGGAVIRIVLPIGGKPPRLDLTTEARSDE